MGSQMDLIYQKTQFGTTSLVLLAAILLFMHLTGWITNEPASWLRVTDIALVVLAIPLSTLTIRVTPSGVEWWFTFGLARQRIPLSDVTSVRSISTPTMWGLGVHWSENGVLWAVSGPRALMMDVSGDRHIAISTNDPDRLVEVVERLKVSQ
jgi:hypothetical protein